MPNIYISACLYPDRIEQIRMLIHIHRCTVQQNSLGTCGHGADRVKGLIKQLSYSIQFEQLKFKGLGQGPKSSN